MATVDKIRNGLIDKILSINDKDFLEALDKLISSSTSQSEIVSLTKEQKEIINRSQKEYSEGNFSTNDVVNEEMEKWLKE